MAKAFRVIAPYVTVRVASPTGGETVLGFYRDGVLPASAMQESVDSLLGKGMIEEFDGPTPEQQAKADEKAEQKADKAAEKAAADAAAKQKAADEAAAKKADAERVAAEKAAAKSAKAETK